MSYQEKNITISLMSTLLILGFYLINVFQIYQDGSLNLINVFTLWGTVIVLAIIVNIVSNIITHIVFSIIYTIKTDEEEPFIADERDEFIGLKGTRNSYYVFAVGVFLSMGTLVIDMPLLVMFNLLIVSAFVAEIIGDFSRLYLYRRGF